MNLYEKTAMECGKLYIQLVIAAEQNTTLNEQNTALAAELAEIKKEEKKA